MIVSWNWLTDYLRLDMPVELLTERLTLAGLNRESIADVGGDIAVDLDVTSNRPDCLGHLGVAREIGVLFQKELWIPEPRPAESGPPVDERTSVAVLASDLCPRFTGRVISGVSVGQSPWWMRKRLETIGVRPISNIVDVTNYVMFECGQPLHAYDLDRLAEHRLVVRRGIAGERLTAINNRVYELGPEMLVIADAVRPVGLAGVMGGAETEIGFDTTDVLIEAAQFDAMSVRRTSRALGLFSPSSFRFERPLDPVATEWASRRCAELILDVAGGTLHPGVIDVGPPPPKRLPIKLRLAQIERTLGIAIDRATVASILKALGLEWIGEDERSIHVIPPSWRSDLEREIDLIEEVARVHGYEHIPEDRAIPLSSTPRGLRERVESSAREILTGCGFDEAVTFSLVDDRYAASLGPGPAGAPLRVDHSSRKRESALRQSLVPSLLSVRLHNEAHGQFDAELFEIANVYLPRWDRTLPDERTRLALVSGRDFRGQKGVVESLLERLHVELPLIAAPAELPMFAAGRAAELLLGEIHLGYLGEIDKAQLEAFELRESCAAAELEFGVLLERARLVAAHHPLPPFPAVVRDLSLVVSRALPWSRLCEVVIEAAGPTLESTEYLDTFVGGNLPEGCQSVHFSIVFRHGERTLTGEEVERAVKSVVEACESRLGGKLRA
ncbi:MAG: phenylalanine--tRNA ligase subunit beta [Isosphaeraceae bacterium]